MAQKTLTDKGVEDSALLIKRDPSGVTVHLTIVAEGGGQERVALTETEAAAAVSDVSGFLTGYGELYAAALAKAGWT